MKVPLICIIVIKTNFQLSSISEVEIEIEKQMSAIEKEIFVGNGQNLDVDGVVRTTIEIKTLLENAEADNHLGAKVCIQMMHIRY